MQILLLLIFSCVDFWFSLSWLLSMFSIWWFKLLFSRSWANCTCEPWALIKNPLCPMVLHYDLQLFLVFSTFDVCFIYNILEIHDWNVPKFVCFFIWSAVFSFLDNLVATKARVVACKTDKCSIIILFWERSVDGWSL